MRLGTPADFKIGTVTWLREHELFVLHVAEGFGVFSSRCTHLGCTVRRTESGFACPCHGAEYDALGRVTQGPARAPLPWHEIEVGPDGALWARRDHTVDAGTLVTVAGARAAAEEPS
jgi:Rieske Fe-S protein